MAGPLNGISSQQVPLATPFQPGQNSAQVRPQEKQPQDNTPQARNAAAANTQRSDSDSRNLLRSLQEDALKGNSGSVDQRRGQVLDITV